MTSHDRIGPLLESTTYADEWLTCSPVGSNEIVRAISFNDLQEFHFMTDRFHLMTEPTHMLNVGSGIK